MKRNSSMKLEELRQEIDKLDDEIVALLAERQKCVEKVAAVKSDKTLIVDQKRIEEVVTRVKRLAKEKGMSEKMAESLWRKLIELSIDHEYKMIESQEEELE